MSGVIYKQLTIPLTEQEWARAERLRRVLNAHLRSLGKPEMSLSAVATRIIGHALEENSRDYETEYIKMELERESVRLAESEGPDAVARAGLPPASYRRRTDRGRFTRIDRQ